MMRRLLTISQILHWATLFREANGSWPNSHSGEIPGTVGDNWRSINNALYLGLRGLPGGSSLTKLLAEERGVRNSKALPTLTEENILTWADAHFQRTRRWPTPRSGAIPEAPGETWSAVQSALSGGARGQPGGSTLAQLLEERRGVRNLATLPPLTEEQIVAWADAYHDRTGSWPSRKAGAILEAAGERWSGVQAALVNGNRGLPGGSSLRRLLQQHRGVAFDPEPLSEEQILAWADAYFQQAGRWPRCRGDDGPGDEESWLYIDKALRQGLRSLPGGSSLPRLLAARRGARNQRGLPRLRVADILAWAGAHRRRTGSWPTRGSGPIAEAPGDTWSAVDSALYSGRRGCRGGDSLVQLLVRRRGRRSVGHAPPLSYRKIVAWADAHRQRTGRWPTQKCGAIIEAPGETWSAVAAALRVGTRGLPGKVSLAGLLARKRGRRNHRALPPLTVEQIVSWARGHHRDAGGWPTARSGQVAGTGGETWLGLDLALRKGRRGLPSGSSLAQVLAVHCGARNPKQLPAFTEAQIVQWARDHAARTGRWPTRTSGPIPEVPGETWMAVAKALHRGRRGLPAGLSLRRLELAHRAPPACDREGHTSTI